MTFGIFVTVCMREYTPALMSEAGTLCIGVIVWAPLTVICASFGLNLLSYIPTMINYLSHQFSIQWTCPWRCCIFPVVYFVFHIILRIWLRQYCRYLCKLYVFLLINTPQSTRNKNNNRIANNWIPSVLWTTLRFIIKQFYNLDKNLKCARYRCGQEIKSSPFTQWAQIRSPVELVRLI